MDMGATSDLCLCGCGAELPPRPLYIHGHQLRESGYTVEDRGYTTPCWIAVGKPYKNGYINRSTVKNGVRGRIGAHRLAYAQTKGPIPDGLVIDHLCRVTMCVNPDHLEAVTVAENVRRTTQVKLNPDLVRKIRAEEGTLDQIAARYGVSRSTVGYVRQRKLWADVE